MRTTRRQLLAAVGTVGSITGCVTDRGGSTTPEAAASGEGESSTTSIRSVSPGRTVPTPTDCPEEPRVPDGTPAPNGTEIPPVPEPPDSVTDDGPVDPQAVADYVERYELVYRWRDLVGGSVGPLTAVFLEASVTVRTVGRRWVVVDVTGFLAGRWDSDPTATDTSGHFDGSRYRASYLVTKSAVWRAAAPLGENGFPRPDPVADGELLACFRARQTDHSADSRSIRNFMSPSKTVSPS